LSLGINELEYLTHREIFNAYSGLVKKRDGEIKLAYEVARWNHVHWHNAQVKSINQYKKVTDFVVFNWEKEKIKDTKMTKKQQIKMSKKIRLRFNDKRYISGS